MKFKKSISLILFFMLSLVITFSYKLDVFADTSTSNTGEIVKISDLPSQNKVQAAIFSNLLLGAMDGIKLNIDKAKKILSEDANTTIEKNISETVITQVHRQSLGVENKKVFLEEVLNKIETSLQVKLSDSIKQQYMNLLINFLNRCNPENKYKVTKQLYRYNLLFTFPTPNSNSLTCIPIALDVQYDYTFEILGSRLIPYFKFTNKLTGNINAIKAIYTMPNNQI